MTRWLAILGMGEDGYEALSAQARARIEAAEYVVGGARHLAMLPAGGGLRETWDTPLALTVEKIVQRRGRPVAVLATGDPMWFGIGVTLSGAVAPEEMLVLPAPSAFSLACARLGWSLADVDCLTLHGRPLELLNEAALPGGRLLLLSHDGTTPLAVAGRLRELGLGPSRMTVLEHMGGPGERKLEATAAEWREARTADLNTIAVEVEAGPGASVRARLPGLPDEAFVNDGQLTKREVRAATLAALAPLPGNLLWDVGAGSGSIAVEWLRCDRSLRAVALERSAARVETIRANAAQLGVPRLEVRLGEAPSALGDLPAPDAVFVGGGLSTPGLIEACWSALRPMGRLVANAVTVEGEARLFELRGRIGGELVRISVSRAEPVGPFTGWRSLAPVTQLAARKR